MKILLINPAPSGTLKATGVLFPPLGLLYVAAYAEKEGHQVVVRDLAVRKKKEDIVFKQYDIVGISTDTTRHRQALQLAKRAKVSGCTVVMGGPHPGYVDQEILSTKRVDFIVRGEGEITFSELVAALQKNDGKFHSIQGISFISNGQIVRTPPRAFIENLDSLPHLPDILFIWTIIERPNWEIEKSPLWLPVGDVPTNVLSVLPLISLERK